MSLNTRQKGNTGESICCEYLVNKGYFIFARNYAKKWGELDIVATKDNIVHFFEVKSIQISYRNYTGDVHKPEDNVDGWKVKHLRRIIESFLMDKCNGMDTPFQVHVLCVYMDYETRKASIKWIKDVVL